MSRILPAHGTHIANEFLRLRTMARAAHEFFAEGEYAAARRQFMTVRKPAYEVLLAERVEKRKRKGEAEQWLAILVEDARAESLSTEVSLTIGESASPEFLENWARVRDQIDKHVMARAIEMGNVDQKVIAKGLGGQQTLHWQEKLSVDELTRFARTVARKL